MKRLIAIVMITLALALAVSGCAAQKPAKDIELEIGGKRALVDTQNGTVNVEGDVYRYAFTADGVLAIEYPNGYGFTRKTVSTGGTAAYATSFLTAEGEPSDKSAEELGFLDGNAIAAALDGIPDASADTSAKSPALAILLILAGVWLLASPRSAWRFGRGWRFREAEPSALALTLYRVMGGVSLAAGAALLIRALSLT